MNTKQNLAAWQDVQSRWSAVLLLVIVSILSMTTSCSDDNTPNDAPMLKGKISSYNEFGGAMLDFTEADMAKAGFTLGDVISIIIDDREIVMPYYDGYYARTA